MARQSEGRWIARAAVGILREITTIEINRGEQIPPDPSLLFSLGLILNHVFYFKTKYLTESVNFSDALFDWKPVLEK